MTCPLTTRAADHVGSTLAAVILEHGEDMATEVTYAFFAAWAAGLVRMVGADQATRYFYRLADLAATGELSSLEHKA